MFGKREFVLRLWENSEEYKTAQEAAVKRLDDLTKAWKDKYSGQKVGIDFSSAPIIGKEGNFVTYVEGIPSEILEETADSKCKGISCERALENALRYGYASWWELPQIEMHIGGWGDMLAAAMFQQGYKRKVTKRTSRWVKRKKEDIQNPIEIAKLHGKQFRFREVSGFFVEEEYKKLIQLIKQGPKFPKEPEKPYNIYVGTSGMICFEVENKDAANLILPEQGWIIEKQPDFLLKSKNVGIIYEVYEPKKTMVQINAVHIVGRKIAKLKKGYPIPEAKTYETIWPARIGAEQLSELARKLASELD